MSPETKEALKLELDEYLQCVFHRRSTNKEKVNVVIPEGSVACNKKAVVKSGHHSSACPSQSLNNTVSAF